MYLDTRAFDIDFPPNMITACSVNGKKLQQDCRKPVKAWFKHVSANIQSPKGRLGKSKDKLRPISPTYGDCMTAVDTTAERLRAWDELLTRSQPSSRWSFPDGMTSPSLSSRTSSTSTSFSTSPLHPSNPSLWLSHLDLPWVNDTHKNPVHSGETVVNIELDDDTLISSPWLSSPSIGSDASSSTGSDKIFDSPTMKDTTSERPDEDVGLNDIQSKVDLADLDAWIGGFSDENITKEKSHSIIFKSEKETQNRPISWKNIESAPISRNCTIKQNDDSSIVLVGDLELMTFRKQPNDTPRHPSLPSAPPITAVSLKNLKEFEDDVVTSAKRRAQVIEWILKPVGSRSRLVMPITSKQLSSTSKTVDYKAGIVLERAREVLIQKRGGLILGEVPVPVACVERRDFILDRLPTTHQLRHSSLDCPCIRKTAKRQKRWSTMFSFHPSDLSKWDIIERVDLEQDLEFDDLRRSPTPTTASTNTSISTFVISEHRLSLELEHLLDADFDIYSFHVDIGSVSEYTSPEIGLPTFSASFCSEISSSRSRSECEVASSFSFSSEHGSTAEFDICRMDQSQYIKHLRLTQRSSGHAKRSVAIPPAFNPPIRTQPGSRFSLNNKHTDFHSRVFADVSASNTNEDHHPAITLQAVDVSYDDQNTFPPSDIDEFSTTGSNHLTALTLPLNPLGMDMSSHHSGHKTHNSMDECCWNYQEATEQADNIFYHSSDTAGALCRPSLLAFSKRKSRTGNPVSCAPVPVEYDMYSIQTLERKGSSNADRPSSLVSLRTPPLPKRDPSRRRAIYFSFGPPPQRSLPDSPAPSLPPHIVYPRMTNSNS